MRLIMAADERAKYFVRGNAFESELAASYPVGVGAEDDVACRVLVRLPWTDAGRSSRALQMIDTEVRRVARALTTADAGGGDLDLFPDEADCDGHRLRDALLEFPPPDTTSTGHLTVVSAASSPLRLLLEPYGSVAILLRKYPLAAATFAMSVFGLRMTVAERRATRLEAVEFGSPDAARDAMDRALWHEDWSGSRVGHSSSYIAPGRPGLFRGVSGATTTIAGEEYASLGLYLFSPSADQGYAVTVRLLDVQSSTIDFGERFSFM